MNNKSGETGYRSSAKRYIPGTNPSWGLELPPPGKINSFTTIDGHIYNGSWTFDESDGDGDGDENEDVAPPVS